MLEILHNVNVNWMGRRAIAYTISGLCVLVSIVSLVMHGGPRYGIDFTGGTLLEVTYAAPKAITELRTDLERAGHEDAEIQAFSFVTLLMRPRTVNGLPPSSIA